MEFVHELIKGKIAETIFEHMFRETHKFTVLRFGYESTVPNLAQYRKTLPKAVIDQISTSPDFILITEDKKQAYFVEVKFRANLKQQELLKIAEKNAKKWEFSYIFLASKDGFYFSPVHRIVNNKGAIEKLPISWVPKELQKKFFKLVLEYLVND
ncbi:MAG: hypothetical protein Q7S29_04710 [Candidatus Peribacter sp.]|nr:hypothetical protein [Candidatus Peribacter sp.]